MKLDRNGKGGLGKYAVVKLRKMEPGDNEARAHLDALITGGFVQLDNSGDEDEFFVIRLKDRFAAPALRAYAEAAAAVDPEYAVEVLELVVRAIGHPNRKTPD